MQIRNTFLDKKLIGTLFEEEEITKKDNIYNQEAKNDKGQKRFHGAFEGGFEAGYKNTVGSREGWAPQKFVSSRGNRAQYEKQTISQFMDEEDKGKQKLGVNVTITADYDTYGVNEISYLQQQLGSGWLFGKAPEELIYRDNKSIGYQVLQELKKQLKRNTQIKELEEYDLSVLSESNNKFMGYGYRGGNSNHMGSSLESSFWTFVKQQQASSSEFDEEKKRKENRIRMNFIENNELQEEYSRTMVEEDELEQPRKLNKQKEMFIKDILPLRMDIKDYNIEVPQDYDPYYRAKQLLNQGYDESMLFLQKCMKKQQIESTKREEVFKEPETAHSIIKDATSKKFVKASTQQVEVINDEILNLYPNHLEKQLKYSNYVLQKQNKQFDQSVINTTDEYEKQEFERVYQMFQVQSKHVQNQEQKKVKEEEKPTNPFYSQRIHKRWMPEEQFCKRMGVPNPYSVEERQLLDKLVQKKHKPNMAGDSNRDFLIMDKKEFTSGGVYQEGQQGVENNARFDPTSLGLPLSFKSHSYERNQQQRMQQIQDIELNKNKEQNREQRQYKKQQKFQEDAEDTVGPRIEDQSIFDLIFGDE